MDKDYLGDLMTLTEVSELLRTSEAAIRMRVKRGFLRAYYPTPRTMVFRRSDILKYLESTTANIKSSLSGKEA